MNFFKKKIVYIPLLVIVYLSLFINQTRVCGILTMLGMGGLLYYLFSKNIAFKSKNKVVKSITTLSLIIVFLFGLICTTVDVNSKSNTASAKKTLASNTNKKTEEKSKQREIQNKKETEEKAKQEKVKQEKEREEKERKEKIKQEHGGVAGELKIHYIDVGQADSILIQQGDKSMLIDAGNNDDSELVKSYIEKQGITALDYVVGTHPHEDHIGGLDYVINSFNIGNVFMPKKLSTTNTFKDVINAVKSKGLQITSPQVGQSYELGEAKFTILGPKQEYENINDNSIVIKMTFGNNSFLFTGDAEATAEMDMVKAGLELKSDVIKVGHHGSKTSTCANFLEKVNPIYSVISCGKDNKYRLPNKSVMDRLKNKNIKAYRTDECGTIVLTSDGKDIKFNCKEGSYNYRDTETNNVNNKKSSISTSTGSVAPVRNSKSRVNNKTTKSHSNGTVVNNTNISENGKVYYTPKGKCYHSSTGCPTLSRSRNIITGTVNNCGGRRPCSKCY